MVDNCEDIVGRTWLIRKSGYFYRPNKSGYTTSKAEAGRYNEADAKLECEIEPWHMKAIPENDWPDDPVSKDISDTVTRLRAENDQLRRERDAFAVFCNADQTRLVVKIAALEAKRDAIRDEAFEEAAKAVEANKEDASISTLPGDYWLDQAAAVIRALKSEEKTSHD